MVYRNFSLPVVLYILAKLFKISSNCRHYVEKLISTLVSLYTVHFNDNTQRKPRDHPDYDPLFKVSLPLNRLRDAMARIEPEERHSVDEQIIPFKRQSGLKQYIKNKPHC